MARLIIWFRRPAYGPACVKTIGHFLDFVKCLFALIKQDTLMLEYNPIIEVLNDKTNKQKLYGRI